MTGELDSAKAEAAKMKDLTARSQADLQNAKARVEREASRACRVRARSNAPRNYCPPSTASSARSSIFPKI